MPVPDPDQEPVPDVADLLRPPPPPAPADRIRALLSSGVDRWPSLFALVALALGFAVAWLVLDREPSPPVPLEALVPAETTTTAPAGPTGPSAPAPPGSATTAPAELVVQIAGAVARPGVYELPPGSRVADLLDVAGGPSAGAEPDRLRLAAPLSDGQRIYVPAVGEGITDLGDTPSTTPPGAGTPVDPAEPLDLNEADAAALDRLPGIGPATAQAILDHRTRIGRFRSIDDLLAVRGIGPARLEQIRPLVRV